MGILCERSRNLISFSKAIIKLGPLLEALGRISVFPMALQNCLQYHMLCYLCSSYQPNCYGNSALSTPAPKTPLVLPNFTVSIQSSQDHNAILGSSVLLTCRANGKFMDGHHKWRWTKDNKPLPSDIKAYFGYLRIPKTNWNHSGHYKCEVERKHVKRSVEFKLTVLKGLFIYVQCTTLVRPLTRFFILCLFIHVK